MCISGNDNGPVLVIPNVHRPTTVTTVKSWCLQTKEYINIDQTHAITLYNKYIGGVDSLVSLVGVYQIDVKGKKWYWFHYISTVFVLKSASCKAFLLGNPEAKMDFLQFTRRILMHYLKAVKVAFQLPPNIIYPRKNS